MCENDFFASRSNSDGSKDILSAGFESQLFLFTNRNMCAQAVNGIIHVDSWTSTLEKRVWLYNPTTCRLKR